MIMTIVSSLISLACVYNVVAGGNKPQSGAISKRPATAASAASQSPVDDASNAQPKVLLNCRNVLQCPDMAAM